MRREFSRGTKLEAYEKAGGKCQICGVELRGIAHYDHRIPDAIGGANTVENCSVVCKACHGVKTATQDVPTIAKSKRVRMRHAGIKKPSTFRRAPPGYDSFRRQWRE